MLRGFATVLLGLQALLWGGGSIIEARVAAESLSRYSHVEDQGSTTCPPLHSHVDCLICRTWHSGAASGQPATMAEASSADAFRGSSIGVAAFNGGFSGTLGSRAPPRG